MNPPETSASGPSQQGDSTQPVSMSVNSAYSIRPSETLCLAQHDDYQITFHPAKDPKGPLIITFAGQPGDMAAEGFGTGFCLNSGYDSIYVAQRYETHFQGLHYEDFAAIIRPHTTGRRVICYGSSLGAYAALYYGGTLDAEILAGAPMLPSWPAFGTPKYADFQMNHGPIADTPLSSYPPTIIFDPLVPKDVQFLESVVRPAYPSARYVEVPHGGHTVLAAMNEANILTSLVLAYFDTGILPDFTLPTDGFAPYHTNSARYFLRKRNMEEATHHANEAFQLKRNENTFAMLFNCLHGAKRHQDLLALIHDELSEEEREKMVYPVKRFTDIMILAERSRPE